MNTSNKLTARSLDSFSEKYYPIPAFLGQDRLISVLHGLDEDENLKAPQAPAGPHVYNNVQIKSTQVTSDVAISLGFGSLVSIGGTGSSYMYVVDVVALLPGVPVPSSVISSLYYGIGIRLGLKAWSIDTKFSSSVSFIAAAASLSMASTAYEFISMGPGLDVLPSLKPLIVGSLGPFNNQVLQNLGAALEGLVSYLSSQGANLEPVPISVDLDFGSPKPASLTLSGTFALNQIRRCMTLQQAKAAIPQNLPYGAKIDEAFVEAIYSTIVQSPTAKPTPAQSDAAKGLLALGN